IAVDPDNPMTLYVNNYDGGVFKSTDGAETWVDSSQGYTGAKIFAIAMDPHQPYTVYATCRASIFRSVDGGTGWQGLATINQAVEPCGVALNPINPRDVLIGKESGVVVLKSNDGGDYWRVTLNLEQSFDLGNPIGIKAIAYAPSDANTVYTGTRRKVSFTSTDITGEALGIYKSTDGGETWVEKNGGLESSSKNINAILVSPQNPDIAYAATPDQGVLKTDDGGESWSLVNNGLMSLVVESLAINPENPNIIYAGLAEGVGIFKTTDGGELWEAINAGIQVECPSFLQRVGQVQTGVSLEKPKRVIGGEYYSIPWTNIGSIVIDPVEPQTLYAADLHLGVYMSTDGGLSWTPINHGLSTKAVSALAISADGRVLYAATTGEGVFRLELW
ncbi:WD40/YVTN/BNR-like repeat-containing protein, partial [Chloroflexota bacterium]